MTMPADQPGARDAPRSMTPERWRVVDTILKAALACEPARREAFVADACGGDADLRREVASLLAAHDSSDHAFLERPAAEAVGTLGGPPVPVARARGGAARARDG